MRFILVKDYDAMSETAAKLVVEQIENKPASVLGFATGDTPLGLYRYLIEYYKRGTDFSRIISFNLDEYYGLAPEHPQSYAYFMNRNLFNHINIKKNNIYIPNGLCKDIEKECQVYEKEIADAGGIDLQILGIGRNGHIGFNEPVKTLKTRTHVTNLSKDTILANSRFFNSIDEVPSKAITMGLGTIMMAKKIILLVSGGEKAEAASKIVEPIVDSNVPASMLQLHNDTTVVIDEEAAILINKKALEQKPVLL